MSKWGNGAMQPRAGATSDRTRTSDHHPGYYGTRRRHQAPRRDRGAYRTTACLCRGDAAIDVSSDRYE